MSGSVLPGRVTAVMGPSGAGKSTFLSVLMGKVSNFTGETRINGEKRKISDFKKLIGFVPQEDVMLRDLTVYENVSFAAKTRLSSNVAYHEVEAHVRRTLEALDLMHVAHIIIGDELRRGISGGQRKRVNIALELVGVPVAMFLDEPTSGLDSAAALHVCQTLHMMATTGLTVHEMRSFSLLMI
eukprot:Lithocolla_globosa_v1_NODE_1518_length_2517_cov_9.259139.p2 type:complete len:184 gc:universal NODE_1518_length_2517_cov_9.259139:1909-1358(-)